MNKHMHICLLGTLEKLCQQQKKKKKKKSRLLNLTLLSHYGNTAYLELGLAQKVVVTDSTASDGLSGDGQP
jgi:hypothetical protein